MTSTNHTTTACGGAQHHPLLRAWAPWHGHVPAGYIANFLGVRTRTEFFRTFAFPEAARDRGVRTDWPRFDEEYFEWVDLLTAVASAKGAFTMIELGAGHGRWIVNAALAARRRPELTCRFVSVEAEPTHFVMMRQHLIDNGLDPDGQGFALIEAAVAAQDGAVDFVVGHADEWYGHAMVRQGRMPRMPELTGLKAQRVRAIGLAGLLAQEPTVDLIDLDVQGAELEVLISAAAALAERVRCVHVGTHNATVEAGLRLLFGKMGWTSRWDFACKSACATPYGLIAFEDGVQTWVNPALCGGQGRSVN